MHRPAPPSINSDGSTFLRPLLNVLRARKWIILQVLVIVPAVAVGLSMQQKPRYEASSQVLISRTNLGNVLTGTQDPAAQEFDFNRIIQTQANLARTPRVARRTLEAARMFAATPESFLAQSSVTTDANTDILTMRVQDADRRRAIRLASHYAREFVRYKEAQTVARLENLQRDLTAELAKLPPGSALAQQDRAQLRRIRNLIALGDSTTSVIHTARSAEQIQPRTIRNAILGVIAGLVLGVALAFFVDLLDTRLRRGEDVGERLGLPLLGRIPEPPRALRKADKLVTVATPDSPEAESFRVLRTNLSFADIDGMARSIIVSSAVQSEGKSTTAANLAIALARAGRHVVLADFDFRRPYMERFFGVPRVPGATSVALGDVTLDEALRSFALHPNAAAAAPDGEDAGERAHANGNGNGAAARAIAAGGGRLELLAAGELPPNVGEFVTSAALRKVIAQLRDRCDVLLIDTPPLLQVGDAMALSAHVDALVLVARLGVVRRGMVDELVRTLGASPVSTLGVVITDAARDDENAGYGYGYYEERGGRNGRAKRAPKEPAVSAGTS